MTPAADELEISIFGPGGGECSVVHLGSDCWVLIDSCVNADKEPAGLAYLRALGVKVETAVKLVLVTHWHDDHIKGMGETVAACEAATISFPLAFLDDEFTDLVDAFENVALGSFTDGLSEIRKVFRIAHERGNIKFAIEERTLWSAPMGALAHGEATELRALSPSDQQVSNMLKSLAKQMPQHGETMYRVESSGRNDVSAAAWVSSGSTSALLGADVETTSNPKNGWDAILAGRGQVSAKATVFKVPHHGSHNGHHGKVWTDLLETGAIAVVTPWQRGAGLLPKHSDIVRLLSHAGSVFATSAGTLVKAKKRLPMVDRTLRDSGYNLTSVESLTGQVRLRAKPGEPWKIELFDGAMKM